jgi:hypothetical protein
LERAREKGKVEGKLPYQHNLDGGAERTVRKISKKEKLVRKVKGKMSFTRSKCE